MNAATPLAGPVAMRDLSAALITARSLPRC